MLWKKVIISVPHFWIMLPVSFWLFPSIPVTTTGDLSPEEVFLGCCFDFSVSQRWKKFGLLLQPHCLEVFAVFLSNCDWSIQSFHIQPPSQLILEMSCVTSSSAFQFSIILPLLCSLLCRLYAVVYIVNCVLCFRCFDWYLPVCENFSILLAIWGIQCFSFTYFTLFWIFCMLPFLRFLFLCL